MAKKIKYENIHLNEKANFEYIYNEMQALIAHMQNCLIQLAAAHKGNLDEKNNQDNC